MTYIPVTEAMKRLGKSDRQVRRMAHEGKLTWRHVPHEKGKRLEILAADVDRLSRHALPAQELERLDRLEQELIQLRERLDTLSKQVEFTTPDHQKSILRKSRTQPGPSEQKSTMPEGLVGWRRFSRLHGISESTVQGAIESEQLPVVSGKWIVGKAPVQGALDATGRARFYELYHDKLDKEGKPQFQPCDECPHML